MNGGRFFRLNTIIAIAFISKLGHRPLLYPRLGSEQAHPSPVGRRQWFLHCSSPISSASGLSVSPGAPAAHNSGGRPDYSTTPFRSVAVQEQIAGVTERLAFFCSGGVRSGPPRSVARDGGNGGGYPDSECSRSTAGVSGNRS